MPGAWSTNLSESATPTAMQLHARGSPDLVQHFDTSSGRGSRSGGSDCTSDSIASLLDAIEDNAIDGHVSLRAVLGILRDGGHDVPTHEAMSVMRTTDASRIPVGAALDFVEATLRRPDDELRSHEDLDGESALSTTGNLAAPTKAVRVGLWVYLCHRAREVCGGHRNRLPAEDDETESSSHVEPEVEWDPAITLQFLRPSPMTLLALLSSAALLWNAVGISMAFGLWWATTRDDVTDQHLRGFGSVVAVIMSGQHAELLEAAGRRLQNTSMLYAGVFGASGDHQISFFLQGSALNQRAVLLGAISADTASVTNRALTTLQRAAGVMAATPDGRPLGSMAVQLASVLRGADPAAASGWYLHVAVSNGTLYLVDREDGTLVIHDAPPSTVSRCLQPARTLVPGVSDLDGTGQPAAAAVRATLLPGDTGGDTVTACFFRPPSQQLRASVARVVPVLQSVTGARFLIDTGILDTSGAAPVLQLMPLAFASTPCAQPSEQQTAFVRGQCEELMARIATSPIGRGAPVISADLSAAGGATTAGVLAASLFDEDDRRVFLIAGLAFLSHILNIRAVGMAAGANAKNESTEVWVGYRDSNTGEVVLQGNPFVHADECLGVCSRTIATSDRVLDLLLNKDSGHVVHADYRPQPVATGFSYDPTLQMAICIDRGVVEINTQHFATMANAFDDFNRLHTGEMSVILLRNAARPPVESYDPLASCSPGATCVEFEGLGFVYRSDCTDCVRFPRSLDVSPQGRNLSVVAGGHLATTLVDDFTRTLAAEAAAARLAGEEEPRRYRAPSDDTPVGRALAVETSFFVKYDTVLAIVHDTKSEEREEDMIYLAVGLSLLVAVLAACIVLAVLRHLLRGVEGQWRRSQQRIAEEKQRFVDNVRDIMPQFLVGRLSEKLPAAAYASAMPLTLMFLEMCDMKEHYKTWPPALVSRFASYMQYTLDALCQHYSLHRVRYIGDRAFVLGGLGEGDETAEEADKLGPAAVRVLQFSAAVQRISSRSFAHFPGRVAALHKAYGPSIALQFPDVVGLRENVGCVNPPDFRVGVHQAEVVATLASMNGRPHFDVYGNAVGVAQQVMQRAPARSILVTAAVRETIAGTDAGGSFVLRPAVTLISTRGKWRTQTYSVALARCPLPHAVLSELGIRPAERCVDCTAEERVSAPQTTSGPSQSSMTHQSE